jgi:hypothetical protein
MRINAANHQACIARIAARGSIGKEEASALLEEVSEAAERMRRSGADEPIVTAAWSLARDLKQEKVRNRVDALRNAGKRNPIIAESIQAKSVQPIRSRMWPTAGVDRNLNIQTHGSALYHGWTSTLWNELRKGLLLKTAASRSALVEIYKAMGELRGMKASTPIAKPYRDIAEISRSLLEAARTELNGEGAHIADATDHIIHTSHDAWLMRRGGRDSPPIADYQQAFSQWRGAAEAAFDPFDPVVAKPGETRTDAMTRFWKAVYDAKTTGIHLRVGESELLPNGMLAPNAAARYEIGGGNLARKLSESRVLKPKSPELLAQYMLKYGTHTNWLSMMNSVLEHSGRRAALMHYFGTNPMANLRLIERATAEELRRRGDPEAALKFQNDIKGTPFIQPDIEQAMSLLDGSGYNPQSQMWHLINSTLRAFYDVVYLGSVALTHAASLIATFPSEARMHGIGTFTALSNLMKAMLPVGLSDAERAERLAALGALGDGLSRHAADPFAHWQPGGGLANAPGYMAAVHNRFMEAGLLPYIFEHARGGMREMLAENLARQLSKPFDQLNPRLQSVLRRYDIESLWEEMRTLGPDMSTPNGLKYLTPRAGLAHADPLIGRDIADRLAMYYEDAANFATVTAGVRERAMLRTRPGSWQDEMLQLMLQFKTWPVAAMHQVLGRQIYSDLTWGRKAWGVGVTAALSMLAGYLRLSANDLLVGREPRVPRNIGETFRVALHSLAQGGGLGILGDFLFGEVDRMGHSFGEVMSGPAISDFGELYRIFSNWFSSIGTTRKGDVWPELARWGAHHIPFSNLFYLKGAFDYLVLYHLFEALHPGWWGRMNRQMEKQQGRSMMGYTPGAGVPYGVPGFYLGGPRPTGLLAGAGG